MQPPDVSIVDVSTIAIAGNGQSSSNGTDPAASAPSPPSSDSGPSRDPYRGVVLVLLAAAIVGMAGALEAGLRLGNLLLVDTAVTLLLVAGILTGVARAQAARMRPLSVASTTEPQPEAQVPSGFRLSCRCARENSRQSNGHRGRCSGEIGALALVSKGRADRLYPLSKRTKTTSHLW